MKKAFTLIELLVVIAIIAILAAILFPVFAQAKAAAKKASDLSNMKNIATAMQLYIADADDFYPMGQYEENAASGPVWHPWYDLIYPYVKNGTRDGGLFFGREGIFNGPGWPAPQQGGGTYAINYDIFRDGVAGWNGWTNDANFRVFSATSFEDVAGKVWMIGRGANRSQFSNWVTYTPWEWDWIDGLDWDRVNWRPRKGATAHFSLQAGKGDCDFAANVQSNGPLDWAACGMLPRYRHASATNVAFLDSHAKSFARTQNSTSLEWLRYIYIREVSNRVWMSETWYPY